MPIQLVMPFYGIIIVHRASSLAIVFNTLSLRIFILCDVALIYTTCMANEQVR